MGFIFNRDMMNIYVLTGNRMLFNGLYYMLIKHFQANVIQICPPSMDDLYIIESAEKEDVFIVIQEFFKFDLKVLLALNECKARVIAACDDTTWDITRVFDFCMIPRRFSISDLLQALRERNRYYKKEKLSNVTRSQKIILLHTLKGIDICTISSILNITTKTAYQHQRSALTKIGLRKLKDIGCLPDDFINYISLNFNSSNLFKDQY